MTRRLRICGVIGLILISLACAANAQAAEATGVSMNSGVVRTAILLTLLAIIPALFISMTSFIRIAIVLAMVRHAFGMPETPPNPVLVGLALFLSIFVMAPTFQTINADALQPYLAGDLPLEKAVEKGTGPIRSFMLSQVTDRDLETMYVVAGSPLPEHPEDVDLIYLTPAFMLNELRVAFTIGFIILLPFLLIDLVVSSVLLSLGMMMVPPATISLPIKLLMFVVIDGWSLVIHGVLGGFQ